MTFFKLFSTESVDPQFPGVVYENGGYGSPILPLLRLRSIRCLQRRDAAGMTITTMPGITGHGRALRKWPPDSRYQDSAIPIYCDVGHGSEMSKG